MYNGRKVYSLATCNSVAVTPGISVGGQLTKGGLKFTITIPPLAACGQYKHICFIFRFILRAFWSVWKTLGYHNIQLLHRNVPNLCCAWLWLGINFMKIFLDGHTKHPVFYRSFSCSSKFSVCVNSNHCLVVWRFKTTQWKIRYDLPPFCKK